MKCTQAQTAPLLTALSQQSRAVGVAGHSQHSSLPTLLRGSLSGSIRGRSPRVKESCAAILGPASAAACPSAPPTAISMAAETALGFW